ncbi:phosphatase [Croceivirga radicis]|uniref:Phosphatase n=1 Tax=Croceivirga radicis TaxID=1929488 RepID=A0A1V6LRX7_9FLAO|nr:alkaline phosphatase PhoX [Croceivirga radicis]OQD42941.1 phosphatase [Croceivirga radicis]
MRTLKNTLIFIGLATFASCDRIEDFIGEGGNEGEEPKGIELANHSNTAAYFKTMPGFENVEIYSLLSSGDQLPDSPNFVYGSMADGAGLIAEDDGTFTLINNIEADYSIARITLDETFKPVKGEYILNAEATAYTAQCSGSLITPEEHGFGPIYLSGGEWGGSSKGVFATDPYKSTTNAGVASLLPNFGQWSTENAVVIGKDAFPGKTVAFIGDDHSDNEVPSGQLGMYVGDHGDLNGGKLYTLKVITEGINYEMDMVEGETYEAEFIEMEERTIELLDAEAKEKGAMGFSRLEDIDWRRGVGANQREIYFAVTGRKKDGLVGKGTLYGRVYKVVLSADDPTKATISCVLDGDKLDGKAKEFHSPDNIVVTQNYAYIQEDPNGYPDTDDKAHYARLYQYNLNTGEIKTVLECDQLAAASNGIGNATSTWEITGMIDISETIGVEDTFIMITQNHGWEPTDGSAFTDPKASTDPNSRKEGSQMFVVKGLAN